MHPNRARVRKSEMETLKKLLQKFDRLEKVALKSYDLTLVAVVKCRHLKS